MFALSSGADETDDLFAKPQVAPSSKKVVFALSSEEDETDDLFAQPRTNKNNHCGVSSPAPSEVSNSDWECNSDIINIRLTTITKFYNSPKSILSYINSSITKLLSRIRDIENYDTQNLYDIIFGFLEKNILMLLYL